MIDELKNLIKEQHEHLKKLLLLLDIQCKMIINKDIFGLESIVEKLNDESKLIAQIEVARRKMLGNESIIEFIHQSNDYDLQELYNELLNTLRDTIDKKKTNEILIKQQLTFTNRMLNIMNPDRQIKTYNSYGSLSK
ncbi:flagellar protein FlgN [Clostridium butyricum]|uniref:FlgN family protein n=1 Tax=Clostridium butyricum E4 str. BoNT E BL5262 TaxID=632245 RepID=C4IDQ5_CLOBU|nr:flagellar protein FlgN [Clostridium butyricum]APF22158.1 flgN family protein [Clostridium butyricum]EDT75399.1 putative flagellar biosynthesis protein [Clostridium butyricum 5521]EEP55128.1 FlgN family protein [Clostridium butyricum E4 str. BoNT E BL5262]NFL31563.1 flagellar protein FlgN [Clostridium butyricum]NFS18169.1 flagellar protein FlgN [Clostridium butyricum]